MFLPTFLYFLTKKGQNCSNIGNFRGQNAKKEFLMVKIELVSKFFKLKVW